jgi:hypothetical protein
MGLLTQASVAIDGSKFKAVNNRDRNFTRAKMERRMAQIEEIRYAELAAAEFGGSRLADCFVLVYLVVSQAWGDTMSLRLTAALVALAVASDPAFACMGLTVIYQDDFQSADPAWDIGPSMIPIHGNVNINLTR